jgi:Protein of unknown function (DUF2867)
MVWNRRKSLDARAGVIRRITPPTTSALTPLFADASFVDAYAIHLPGVVTSVDALAAIVFGEPSGMFTALMSLRDALVQPFGLKTSSRIVQAFGPQTDRLNMFRVISRRADEVIVGEDDSHLDFRGSLHCRASGDGRVEVILTTVVRCHNWLGRAYLQLVLPFHVLVVRSNLARLFAR